MGDTPPIVKPVTSLTDCGLAIEISFKFLIFFNLFNEHLLSPDTKHRKKLFCDLKRRLLTIEPTSVFKLSAASFAVRAELSNYYFVAFIEFL